MLVLIQGTHIIASTYSEGTHIIASTTPLTITTVGSRKQFILTATGVFTPVANDVIEFDVKYSGPVEFNIPTFTYLEINGVVILFVQLKHIFTF